MSRDVWCSCFSDSLNDIYIRGDSTSVDSCIGAPKVEARGWKTLRSIPEVGQKIIPRLSNGSLRGGAGGA